MLYCITKSIFLKPKVLSSVVKFKIKNTIKNKDKIKKFINLIFINKRKKFQIKKFYFKTKNQNLI